MRSYIKGTTDFNKGRPQKPPQKADAWTSDRRTPSSLTLKNVMIFGMTHTYESWQQRWITKEEVNVVETKAACMCLCWSEVAITFDQEDHPVHVPHPGRFPLLVSPIVEVRLTKVLMDGRLAAAR